MRIEGEDAARLVRDAELDVDLGDVRLREVERDLAHELIPHARVRSVRADHKVRLHRPPLPVRLEDKRACVKVGAKQLVTESQS